MANKYAVIATRKMITKAAKGEFSQSNTWGKGQKRRSIAIWREDGSYFLEKLAWGMPANVISGDHDKIHNEAVSFLSEAS